MGAHCAEKAQNAKSRRRREHSVTAVRQGKGKCWRGAKEDREISQDIRGRQRAGVEETG